MILVIGGAHQGKLRQVLFWMGEKYGETVSYANGNVDSYEEIVGKPVVYGVQAYLLRCIREQRDPESWLKKLIEAEPEYVIMDEVGYGVVPVEPELREYRELIGHAGQLLARQATAVYRIVCGIPMQIK